MLFALSKLSINCSKLSKATSLLESAMSVERIAAMDSFIRSASEGPPKRALRASGLIGRLGGAEVALESAVWDSSEGWEVVAEEVFSMDHLKRSFSLGSMMTGCGLLCCCGLDEAVLKDRCARRVEESRNETRHWIAVVYVFVNCTVQKSRCKVCSVQGELVLIQLCKSAMVNFAHRGELSWQIREGTSRFFHLR